MASSSDSVAQSSCPDSDDYDVLSITSSEDQSQDEQPPPPPAPPTPGSDDSDGDFLAAAATRPRPAAGPALPGPEESPGPAAASAARSSVYGRPSERTHLQHIALGNKMREAKLRKRLARTQEEQSQALVKAVASISDKGLTRAGVSLVARSAVPGPHGLTSRRGPSLTVRVRARGVGTGRKLSLQECVRVAFSDLKKRNDVARVHECSTLWVTTLRMLVADCVLYWQQRLWESIWSYTPRLGLFIQTLAFDETQEKLHLPIHPNLAPQLQRSSWHVLVSRSTAVLAFPGAADSDDEHGPLLGRSFRMQLLRPTVPLISTSAECLFEGLFRVDGVAAFTNFEQCGYEASNISICHWDTDGHFGNLKLAAKYFASLPTNTLASHMVCMLHSGKLVETAVLGALDLRIVSAFYSLSLLFKMGGHFLRFIHVLPAVVQPPFLQIRHDPPPSCSSAAGLFKTEVLNYLWANYKRFDDIVVESRAQNIGQCDSDSYPDRRVRFKKYWQVQREETYRKLKVCQP